MIIVDIPTDANYPPNPFVGKKFDNDIKIASQNIGEYVTPIGHTITFYNYMYNQLVLGISDNIIIFVLALQPYAHPERIQFELKALPVQVWRTYLTPDYRRQGITTKAYEALVSTGATCLVSGVFQSIPIVGVWKKLATESITSEFDVNVVENNVIRKETDGTTSTYDGINIPDNELWSILPDRSKKETLLILIKKPHKLVL